MSVDLASSVPLEEFLSHVPAFIAKLWIMVEDHETDDIISWSNQGRAFTVHDQATLAKELLPKYFKHGNVQSFVRQLNMYNFHKQVSLTSALTEESPTFYHPCFLRDGPGLLVEIRRKVPRNSRVESAPSPDCGNAIVTSQLLKSRSRNLLDEFRELKRARKAVKRGLAELHGWLANGGTPIDNGVKQTGTVTSEETAVDDPHDVRMIDLSKTQSGDQPGSGDLPVANTLRETYLPKLNAEKKDEIKSFVQNKKIVLMCDATTDRAGRCIFIILIKVLSSGSQQNVFVGAVKELPSATGAECSRAILSTVVEFGINYEDVVGVVTDSARYMTKCVSSLKDIFSEKMVHIQCWAHKLNLVASLWSAELGELN
ncbi:heat shock factor protein-like isoform X1 [Bacillus rossius redtenbacheri]|uniref:heat shock factor protein-like isoform X1 n=1 Tax=Bacillus rossius redtenbacheri TaxID=93214 RepID=UPI002FDE609F